MYLCLVCAAIGPQELIQPNPWQVTLEDALREVNQWVTAHPHELVLVYLSHCQGPDCVPRSIQTLDAALVATLSCDDIHHLTLADAERRATRAGGGGGRVLAVWEPCVQEHWEPSVSCYHTQQQGEESKTRPCCCYADSATAEAPFAALWSYVEETVTREAQDGDSMWMLQVRCTSTVTLVRRVNSI